MPYRNSFIIILSSLCLLSMPCFAASPPAVSDDTEQCLGCHEQVHPGIVSDWRQSVHATGSLRTDKAANAPAPRSVGCAECHTVRADKHTATFDHNGFSVHPDVSPADCATCHGPESSQFSENLMQHAYGNLMDNSVYRDLVAASAGAFEKTKTSRFATPAPDTLADTCLYCHGTKLVVAGTVTRDTSLGEMDFPVLTGWPNQGVGRINTDGSAGSCAACHTRHRFSIETARKPYTCKQCHEGPDVPAFKVYNASKHGNVIASDAKTDYTPVPWKAGADFAAPTCAACHISETAAPDGTAIAPRTHRVNDRLSYRLFGVPYATAHPKSPDLSIIRNGQGQPLTATLAGKPAEKFLIGAEEQARRNTNMQALCLACHSTSWVTGHFARLDASVRGTNAATLTATRIMETLWDKEAAQGFSANKNPFDEPAEFLWTRTFLFYANSTRFAAAMSGGGDYATFADGRFEMNQAIAELNEMVKATEKKDKRK
ncbi:MAG: multiheme c-type cytochrome [Thermodesulfobacteriota bacterium]